MIHNGDCVEVMAAMPENSVDAIVCDPPYGLEFMGKEWDSFAPQVTTSRVQRTDGGRLDATVSGPTPQQRHKVSYPSDSRLMRCSKCQGWSGSFSAARAKRQKQCICDSPLFTPSGPPSQMVAFQEWSRAWATEAFRVAKPGAYLLAFGGTRTYHRLAVAIEDAGWIIRDCLVWAYASGFPKSKALLKPAWEPIVMARKPGPLRELAIDACRIPSEPWTKQDGPTGAGFKTGKFMGSMGIGEPTLTEGTRESTLGRWPANVLLTPTEDGRAIFDGGVAGVVGGGEVSPPKPERVGLRGGTAWHGMESFGSPDKEGRWPADPGGSYSRFFLIPKSARSEREPVFGGLEAQHDDPDGSFGLDAARPHTKPDYQYKRKPRTNVHPTVKPLDLMRHLVRLVTPQGGTVLDPFLGSGTTAIAAEMEGFAWIGIEREPEYVAIAEARLMGVQRGLGLDVA
jgi:DNA modification methylase